MVNIWLRNKYFILINGNRLKHFASKIMNIYFNIQNNQSVFSVLSSQFSVLSLQFSVFSFQRQLRTNDLCIREDLLRTKDLVCCDWAWSVRLLAQLNKGRACFALKIEGGSLFAHRASGTTYAAHSLELKVKLKLAAVER